MDNDTALNVYGKLKQEGEIMDETYKKISPNFTKATTIATIMPILFPFFKILVKYDGENMMEGKYKLNAWLQLSAQTNSGCKTETKFKLGFFSG